MPPKVRSLSSARHKIVRRSSLPGIIFCRRTALAFWCWQSDATLYFPSLHFSLDLKMAAGVLLLFATTSPKIFLERAPHALAVRFQLGFLATQLLLYCFQQVFPHSFLFHKEKGIFCATNMLSLASATFHNKENPDKFVYGNNIWNTSINHKINVFVFVFLASH